MLVTVCSSAIFRSCKSTLFKAYHFRGNYPECINRFSIASTADRLCIVLKKCPSTGHRSLWSDCAGLGNVTFSCRIRRNSCFGAVEMPSYGTTLPPTLTHNSVRCMAGHAKWQNVKSTKTAKDVAKSKLCSRIVLLTKNAVKEGGMNPKHNASLRNVMELARQNSIPFSTLENAMKKASSGKMKPGFLEIPGPGGILIVMEYETDNVGVLRREVKNILRKYNTAILSGEGRWRSAFEQKGILKVTELKDGGELNAEQALDSAILAGAEDVQLRVDDGENLKYLEFICEATDLMAVKKELEGMAYKIEEAYVSFIPNVTIELPPEVRNEAENLLSELDDVSDVVRLYENIK